ncbi:MAG: beta-lactamase family protein, partial [Chloroflexi bacterium]|nr:beta-lactamase family protein [Chloroflexota bacterium]
MLRLRTSVMFVLAVVLSLGVALPVGAQGGDEPDYSGAWYSADDGIALWVEDGDAAVYVIGGGVCSLLESFDIAGSDVLYDGDVVYTLALKNGTLSVFENGALELELAYVENLDEVCAEVLDPDALLLALPLDEITSFDDLDLVATTLLAETGIPGMAMAVVTPDGVAWSAGYGFANIEDGIPVTADTPFQLASVSKTMTGTSLMVAVESGALSLDDNINDLLPFAVDNPNVEGEVILVRHLVTHTSSVVDNWPVYDSMYGPGDPTIPLGDFLDGYLVPGGEWYDGAVNYADWMPGEVSDYSNVGAALAGYLVEATTGVPLNEYARATIFEPLGMTNTGWFLAEFDDTSLIAMPYDEDNEAYGYYGFVTWPDGLLRSSANDMGRFLAMVMNGGELDGVRILEQATVDQMLSPQLPDVTGEFGVFWTLGEAGPGTIGHSGGDPGVSTFVYFQPEWGVGVVLLFNSDG